MKSQIKASSKQKGFSLIQAGLVVVVGGLATAYAFAQYERISLSARQNAAFEEVTGWLNEMAAIGVVNSHVYTGLTQADVLARSSIETTTNTYGLAITAAVSTSNWALTYPFLDASSCEYVESRILRHPGLTATAPACNATNQLVAVVE